jgi:hypothetical protein
MSDPEPKLPGADEKDLSLFGARASETGTALNLNFFMTIVVVFFLGLLLASQADVRARLRVPSLFLIVSAIGFIYSALIYANASDRYARLHHMDFARYVAIGNIVSEYLGVYFLIFSTPLAVLGYSQDELLGWIVAVINILAFSAYHLLGFSVLERNIRGKVPFRSTVFAMVALSMGSFLLYDLELSVLYYSCCLILSFFVLGILVVSVIPLLRKE